MARYTGPKAKISRKFGEPIMGPSKALQKKNYPPGQHGKGRRSKKSEYALQLQEKQKVKYTYGMLEKQFARFFHIAAVKPGRTGTNLIQLCESRLDNLVYRMGIAPTRRAARQLVSHGHITVNDTKVNIPSYHLKIGDIITVKEKSKNLKTISESIENNHGNYSWLQLDTQRLTGKLMEIPSREDIPERINEQSIVELYSK